MTLPVMAIYGGAFDPPTLAHTHVLSELIRLVPLKKILVVPSINHVFKTSSVSYQTRLDLCRLAFPSSINDVPIEISNIESVVAHAHPEEKISTRMLYEYCVTQYATYEVKIIIGVDNADTIDTWSSASWVKQHIPFLVIPRGGYIPKESWYRLSDKDFFVEAMMPITGSSTAIREAIKNKCEDLVATNVLADVLCAYKKAMNSDG